MSTDGPAPEFAGPLPDADEPGPRLAEYVDLSAGVSLGALTESRQVEFTASQDGRSYFVTLGPLRFNWIVATVIPASDFLATIERNAKIVLAVLVVLTLVMASLAILAANRLIGAPLLGILGQLKHIESFQLDKVSRLSSPLRELDNLSAR